MIIDTSKSIAIHIVPDTSIAIRIGNYTSIAIITNSIITNSVLETWVVTPCIRRVVGGVPPLGESTTEMKLWEVVLPPYG